MGRKKQKNFLVDYEFLDMFMSLTDAKAGKLFKAWLNYEVKNTKPKLTEPLLQTLFTTVIKIRSDANRAKYEEVCKARQAAGRLGGRPRDPRNLLVLKKAIGTNQLVAKEPDCDCDSDSDKSLSQYTTQNQSPLDAVIKDFAKLTMDYPDIKASQKLSLLNQYKKNRKEYSKEKVDNELKNFLENYGG